MFYNILDEKRINVLPLLKKFKDDFYIAGGTALALQIGHRDSIDFDFFSQKDIDTKKVFDQLTEIFKDYKIIKTQEDRNTLSVTIDGDIKLSFFSYKYNLLNDLINEENLMLGSIEDIGCMKLSAVTGRASNKDYIDLYFILHQIKLRDLLEKAKQKFPNIDTNLILKSLVYFEDVIDEPIVFKNDKDINFEEIKKFLIKEVKNISK